MFADFDRSQSVEPATVRVKETDLNTENFNSEVYLSQVLSQKSLSQVTYEV